MMTTAFPYICLEEARVQAFVAPLIAFPDAFRGGPVLEAEAHRMFRHDRGGKPADSFQPDQTYEQRLSGDYVYAGPVYDHFGHFLAEMVHRIVPAQRMALPGRYLFVTTLGHPSHGSFDALPSYIREALSFCGLSRDAIVIVDRNSIVERLHLVRQGASLGSYPRLGYLDALRDHTEERLDRLYPGVARPKKLYVSRSKMPKTGSFLGESYVERLLERQGFCVFRPEAHGVTEQMDHYRKAEHLVFPGGSACHGAELLGTAMLGNVLLVPRVANHHDLLRRVLKPRSRAYAQADIAIFIGTLLRDRATASDSEHRGVSIFDWTRLASHGDSFGFDLAKAFSVTGYAKAATADLLAYFAETTRDRPDRNTTRKFALLARLAREILRIGLGRGRAPASKRASGPRELDGWEIAEIWMACATLSPPFGSYFRMLLLTLQQQPHVAGMRWSELAADSRDWVIPARRTKTGVAHRVHLSEPVCALLENIPREPRIDHVFHAKGKPINGIAQAKLALDAAIVRARNAAVDAVPANLAPWSPFDLRRTGLRRLDEIGYDRAVIRRAFGLDAGTEAEASLSGGSAEDRARVLEAWGSLVMASLSGQEGRRSDASSP